MANTYIKLKGGYYHVRELGVPNLEAYGPYITPEEACYKLSDLSILKLVEEVDGCEVNCGWCLYHLDELESEVGYVIAVLYVGMHGDRWYEGWTVFDNKDAYRKMRYGEWYSNHKAGAP